MSNPDLAETPQSTARRPTVVMLTKFVPFPANDGGKQRTLAIAKRFAERADVVLCGFDDCADPTPLKAMGIEVRSVPWDPKPAKAILGLCRTGSVSAGRFWDRRLSSAVKDVVQSRPVDLLQVEYMQMAPMARGLPARRRILDLHNVESSLMGSYAASAGFGKSIVARIEAKALRHLERALIPEFDAVAVVSERELGRLPVTPRKSLHCPNGHESSPRRPPPSSEPSVAFVATLGWTPNVEAALWFTREVWPAVQRKLPEAHLMLVGRDPAPSVRSLAGSHVEVTGTVAEVAPYLARARLTVAPLLAGGGSRLKILESLAAGRPVVSTSVGADGLEQLIGRGVVVADDPASMASAVTELLTDPDRAERLGVQGSEAVAELYGWDVVLAPLMAEVDALSVGR